MEQPNLSLCSAALWRASAQEYAKLRSLTFAALMVAIIVAIGSIYIPIPGALNLRVYFSYLAQAVGGAIYGPLVGAGVGLLSDLIGNTLFPSGPFFFGYTLTAILGNFLYGAFFYRRRITILRIFCCKLVINIFVNVGLGCLWSTILYGQGTYFYYAAKSIVKNLLMLPIEVLLISLLFAALAPILKRYNVQVSKRKHLISWK